ncbi:hypothetical protein Bpfe_002525, partial [Biomphalaria pfeifferi]
YTRTLPAHRLLSPPFPFSPPSLYPPFDGPPEQVATLLSSLDADLLQSNSPIASSSGLHISR